MTIRTHPYSEASTPSGPQTTLPTRPPSLSKLAMALSHSYPTPVPSGALELWVSDNFNAPVGCPMSQVKLG